MTEKRVSKQIGIFEPGTPSKGLPDRYVDESEARSLVDDGEADWINHRKAIRLRRSKFRLGSVECNRAFIEKYARPESGAA